MDSQPGVEFFSGLLVPGLVNAHCHTELSYLHGRIEPGRGFSAFADSVGELRQATPVKERIAAAAFRDTKMYSEGIGAIGDICNDAFTFGIKTSSPVKYHSFIEYFGFTDSKLAAAADTEARASELSLSYSATPHSTYSIQDAPFRDIASRSALLSVHFMESTSEAELFHSHGPMAERYADGGIIIDFGKYGSPAQRIVRSVDPSKKILLIHNTFVGKEDIDLLQQHFGGNATWVLCPRSNRYLENAAPPVELFRTAGVKIAIGTDSLASNGDLSIIEELKTFRDVPLEEIFRWATINGAEALGMGDLMGSFEIGKSPGAVIVNGIDWNNGTLLPSAISRRLL